MYLLILMKLAMILKKGRDLMDTYSKAIGLYKRPSKYGRNQGDDV